MDYEALEWSGQYWTYQGVWKQTDAAGGTTKAVFQGSSRWILLWGQVGQNNYGAARTIDIRILDQNDDVIAKLITTDTVDNETLPFPTNNATPATQILDLSAIRPLIFGVNDVLQIQLASLAQNEEITVTLRGLCSNYAPAPTSTGSAGTVTITEVYNQVDG